MTAPPAHAGDQPPPPAPIDRSTRWTTPADAGPPPIAVWAVPAAVTLTICLVGIARPVLWQDELATVSASTRSFVDLVRLSAHRDGVLAAYYALIHAWTWLFGASPVSVRVPSALAMAAGAGVTAVLGARLFGRWAGLLAGLVLAVIPTVSQFGEEARPYALSLLVAAVCTLLLLRAVERPSRGRWAWYGLSLLVLGAVQLTALTLLAGHAVAPVWAWRQRKPGRLPGWLITVGVVIVVLAPLGYVGARESAAISWIPPTSGAALRLLPHNLFDSAGVAALVIAAALIAALGRRAAAWFCLGLATLPTLALVIASLEKPLLLPRYLVFTLFAWALLAGAAIARLRRVGPTAVVIAAVVIGAILVIGLPAQFAVRSPTKVRQPDYRAMAEIMRPRSRAGDAIVMPVAGGIRFRIGLRVYLPAAAWPDDVLATRSPAAAAELDSPQCDPAACLGSPPRLWVGCSGRCADPLDSLPSPVASTIRARGYLEQRAWHTHGGAIALYTLSSSRS